MTCRVQLSDVSVAIVDCEHKTAPTTDAGYPSIRTPNIGRGYFILEGVNRVSRETYLAWTRRSKPEPGDLIMAREAPAGNVAMIPEGLEPCLGQRTLLIKPDRSKVDPRFLAYYLLGPRVQAQVHAKASGATVPHLNMSDVRALDVSDLPPLDEQRRIAGILSAYDDLIENCQRRIKILEEMARSLYREWFVHFRYPGHESVPLVDSPLGPIPQGWHVKKLGDLAREVRDNVQKGDLAEPTPYVGLEHIPRRSLALDDWETATELGSNKLAFKHGDVLFGKIRPYFHKVSVAPFDGLCSADTIVIRTTNPLHVALVTAVTSSDQFVAEATASSNGSKMPRANWHVMATYKVPLPPASLLAKFSDFFQAAVDEQQVLIKQSATLRHTRDLLLPNLLNICANRGTS